MKRKILAALLLVLAACPLSAQLTTGIADDGTERIVLTKNGPDEFHQRTYVKTLLRDQKSRMAPLMDTAPCATLGSQSLARARSPQRDLETLLARYNVVNLWLGNICHGKSDAVPDPAEARAWLLNMQSVNFEGDLLPFLDTHTMLAQLYLFGAPGSAPDYPAALALLNEELKAKASFPVLWFFYIYENGLGVAKDPVQAHVWLQRAADSGAPAAKMLLAQARELHDDKGAFSSYLELSKSVQPPVWFRLGLMYLEGRGTQKDPCKAQEMFQKAASHYWSPVPQSNKYLDQIRTQSLCPQTVLKQPEPNSTAPSLALAKSPEPASIAAPSQIGLDSSEPASCPVKLPEDPGELHPKRLDQSRKVIHDRDEYNAYMAALKLSDPRQKATAMEEFVTRYPKSVVMTDALAQAMAAYQASGNAAKVGETATRMLQLQPDLRPLSIIVFLARDCATRGTTIYTQSIGKQLVQLSQRGLAALPEWQETQGASLPEGAKLRDQMAAIFAGAAGWGALQNRDYATARQFYQRALTIDPQNVQNLYQLAVADLEMSPMDPNGFWYCGKAVSIARNSATVLMSPYCKFKFKKHGGTLEEWDRLVSNTEKDSAPPRDFAKGLSLQEPSRTLEELNRKPGGAAPPSAPEKGDPMSRLIPAPESSPASAGIGSSADGSVVPTERSDHLPEVISLSDNSLSNSDFGSHYGWYLQNISHKIAFNWHAPTDPDPAGHRCTIAFVIQPDGSPRNVRVEKSSGFTALDESAMWAVQRVDSFGPVPTHEKIAVDFWFDSRR